MCKGNKLDREISKLINYNNNEIQEIQWETRWVEQNKQTRLRGDLWPCGGKQIHFFCLKTIPMGRFSDSGRSPSSSQRLKVIACSGSTINPQSVHTVRALLQVSLSLLFSHLSPHYYIVYRHTVWVLTTYTLWGGRWGPSGCLWRHQTGVISMNSYIIFNVLLNLFYLREGGFVL